MMRPSFKDCSNPRDHPQVMTFSPPATADVAQYCVARQSTAPVRIGGFFQVMELLCAEFYPTPETAGLGTFFALATQPLLSQDMSWSDDANGLTIKSAASLCARHSEATTSFVLASGGATEGAAGYAFKWNSPLVHDFTCGTGRGLLLASSELYFLSGDNTIVQTNAHCKVRFRYKLLSATDYANLQQALPSA